MASSTEDIRSQFKSLNNKFNDLMNAENYSSKNGNVLIILEEMLKMIIEKNHILHVESIINTGLLLTNLHKALADFENFIVISVENVLDLKDRYSHWMCFSFIPAEGETSLQRFTEEDNTTYINPIVTFGEVQQMLWPKVKPSDEPNEDVAENKLIFYIRGKQQDFRFSVYQAVLLYEYRRYDDDRKICAELWPFIEHKITYRLTSNSGPEFVEDFSDLEKESNVILQFLSRLHNIGIGREVFVNNRLDKKLNDQLDDKFVTNPLRLPPWWIYVITTYPFLFSYQTRIRFFKLVAYSQRNPDSLETMADFSLGEVKTVIATRNHILDSAKQLMDQHASEDIELRVKFLDEMGIGIGPTSEFYTLVSKEFQKCDLMWRKDVSFGLFPCPSLGSSIEQVKTKFVLLGQMVGKAIQNGKLLDIHFSKAFYKLILGKELSIYDIQSFEPHLGRILLELQEFVSQKNITESDSRYKDGTIEDLQLSFVLPGYEEFSSGYKKDVPVDLINLEDYILFVKDGTIGSGITVQIEAFKQGFKQVFKRGLYPTAIEAFGIFTEQEFEATLCGQAENSWSVEELNQHIAFDGGYMQESIAIMNLFEILQGFNLEQRRQFLQFVTASPRLPNGGLAALNPKLTVFKISVTEESLPCAVTCINRLSLPPYLSKATMKEKLLYAITEGQGSFGFV